MITRKKLPLGLILLLCISLLPISPSAAQTTASPETKIPNFDCYRDAASIISKMQFLAETYSDLSKITPIGFSVEGKEIYALEIGNEANVAKPHFILLAGLHGNDFSQPELGLQLAEKLLKGYDTEADIQWIVDNVEIDLILLANPDGRQVAEGQAATTFESSDVTFITNKNNIDLEENFCFQIANPSEGCSTFPFEPETQAITNYVHEKFGEPITDLSLQVDSQNFFLYFSSHNKETPPSSPLDNLQGRLRIPQFYTPNSSDLTNTLLRLNELTKMLRIIDSDPKYNIETFKTEGLPFSNYPVDYAYFSYGVASIELSAPPTKDSRPMDCSLFNSEHVQNYTRLLINAAKSAAQPYKIGYGPIVDELTKTSANETDIKYHAVIFEKNQIPNQPVPNPITSLRYYIDQPVGTVPAELGGWFKPDPKNDPNTSVINFNISIQNLTPGKHILTLQSCSQDKLNIPNQVCGLPLSAYLIVLYPQHPTDPSPTHTPTAPHPTDTPNDPDPPGPGSNIIYLPLIGR